MRLSPFEITLEVDSDTVNCGDLHGLFDDIHGLKKGQVDFAVMQSTANPAEPIFPQNGSNSNEQHVKCLVVPVIVVVVIIAVVVVVLQG